MGMTMSTDAATEVETKKCAYCDDFTYNNDARGRARYMQHIKREHPDQTKGARERRAQEELLEKMSPLTQRFYEAASRVVSKPAVVTSMVKVFGRYTSTLGSDRVKFRSWAKRYGLTGDQIAQIEDDLEAAVVGLRTTLEGEMKGLVAIMAELTDYLKTERWCWRRNQRRPHASCSSPK